MLRVVKIFVAAIVAVLAYAIAFSALSGLFVLSAVVWIFEKDEGREAIEEVINLFKRLNDMVKDTLMS